MDDNQSGAAVIEDGRTPSTRTVDVLVVGAGFAGLYAVYKFRQLGFTVRAFEAGEAIGGTWYWNRYPGARCDVPSLEYSYSFSPELEQEWEWSEFFPAQEEIERYLNYVADRFDLRRDVQLRTTVVGMSFDESAKTWHVDMDSDDKWVARFVVMATGCLSVPVVPELEGLSSFGGKALQTSRWPSDVDLDGARIALVGTGSSGVQVTPELARIAKHLHVFQRSAAFSWPSKNAPMDPAVQAAVKQQYRDVRLAQRSSPGGVSGFGGVPILDAPRPDKRILGASENELLDALDEYGFGACRVWDDVASDPQANERAVELYRQMVHRVVTNTDTAESLSPRGYPIGCKRPVLDNGYFQAFNRDNVTLIDLRLEPIERVTKSGIQTSARHIEIDVLVLATGFDAMTGALTRVDIRGPNGQKLRDELREGCIALLGLQFSGYPNLFTITGPGSPSVLSNMVPGIEHHIEWISECLVYLRERGLKSIESTATAQNEWAEEVQRAAIGTMYVADTCNSWYLGANIPGKKRVFLPYIGGFGRYVTVCQEVVDGGYAGFRTS